MHLVVLILILCGAMLHAGTVEVYHCPMRGLHQRSHTYEWEMSTTQPFSEIFLSWSATRPHQGVFSFDVSVRVFGEWSPYQLQAEWSGDAQRTYASKNNLLRITNNCSRVVAISPSTAFRIRVQAHDGASLSSIYMLHVATVHGVMRTCTDIPQHLGSHVIANVPLQSQMVLDHPRVRSLCSPTSMSIVIGYLAREGCAHKALCPHIGALAVHVAELVRDMGCNGIYGSWILNTAQVYELTGRRAMAWVQRLNSIEDLIDRLRLGIPIIVSVCGAIEGAPQEYKSGHLMVVIGWDATSNSIICVDPAAAESDQTLRYYPVHSFCRAWAARQNLCYIFERVAY